MDCGEIAGVLVLAGEQPQGYAKAKLLQLAGRKTRPYIAAADGGALYLAALDISPDIIIGDNDSIPEGLFPQVPRLGYPQEKNFSDGEAAYEYMLRQVGGKIAVFSVFGKRPDFFLANMLFPLQWPAEAERFVLWGENCEAVYSWGYAKIPGEKGDILSILPLTSVVKGITLVGLAYGLEDYDLVAGSSRCVSNVFSGPVATVRHQQGLALIIHYINQ